MSRSPRRVLGVAAAALALLLMAATQAGCPRGRGSPGAGQDEGRTRTLRVGGRERSYLYYLPAGHDPARPAPLILAFHGAWTRTRSFAAITGLHRDAGRAGYVVVYPTGFRRSWNAGGCCGPAYEQGVDDVAFVRAVLADVESLVRVDPRRIYATGFSNGSMMTYRLACDLGDRLAAVAPVAAAPPAGSRCDAPAPVPVLHTHGLADRQAPFAGGRGEDTPAQQAVPTVIGEWLEEDRCVRTSEQVVYERGGARCVEHGACARGAEVQLCTVRGLGHQWPGGLVVLPRVYGPGTRDLDANAHILEFFAAHPRAAQP